VVGYGKGGAGGEGGKGGEGAGRSQVGGRANRTAGTRPPYRSTKRQQWYAANAFRLTPSVCRPAMHPCTAIDVYSSCCFHSSLSPAGAVTPGLLHGDIRYAARSSAATSSTARSRRWLAGRPWSSRRSRSAPRAPRRHRGARARTRAPPPAAGWRAVRRVHRANRAPCAAQREHRCTERQLFGGGGGGGGHAAG